MRKSLTSHQYIKKFFRPCSRMPLKVATSSSKNFKVPFKNSVLHSITYRSRVRLSESFSIPTKALLKYHLLPGRNISDSIARCQNVATHTGITSMYKASLVNTIYICIISLCLSISKKVFALLYPQKLSIIWQI